MNLPGISNTSNRTAVDNNRPSAASRAARQAGVKESQSVTTSSEAPGRPDTENEQGFVERRVSPDRRKKNKKPLIDTRRQGDRRRSQVDVVV